MSATCYRILGLDSSATLADVKVAYRRLVAAYHPDRNSGDPYAQQMFCLILTAYEEIIRGSATGASAAPEVTAQRVCRRKRKGSRSDRRYNWQLPQQYIGTQVNCEV